MILDEKTIQKYLGKTLDLAAERLAPHAYNTLLNLEDRCLQDMNCSAIDYLLTQHHLQGKTIKELVAETGLLIWSMNKLFRIYGLPKLDSREVLAREWQDPEYIKMQFENMKARKSDPEFEKKRRKALAEKEKDPEYVKKRNEAMREGFMKVRNTDEFNKKLGEGIRKKWAEDKEFRERKTAATKEMWKDEKFRETIMDAAKEGIAKKMEDPEYVARKSEAGKKRWENAPEEYKEEFKKKASDNWKNPEYREKVIPKIREAAIAQWQDPVKRERGEKAARESVTPEKREKMRQRTQQNWDNEEYSSRQAELIRQAVFDPENRDKLHLSTIKGYRKDIGYSQSKWEANIARMLIYLGFEYTTRKEFRLKVPEKYKDLIKCDETVLTIDFLTNDLKGNLIAIEISSHPTKNGKGTAKLEMFAEQYPCIKLKIINYDKYMQFERFFKPRINADQRFSGWETKRDNLKTNLEKYGVPEKTETTAPF